MNDKPKFTILNVDDHDDSRYTVTQILQQEGFEVIEATSGAEALGLVKKNPDLIILDVHLPDIDGFEVCCWIKADSSSSMIPVLFLSATYDDDLYRLKGLKSGANGYLTEPIEPPVLIGYVKSLLRQRWAEKKVREKEEKYRNLFNGLIDAVFVIDTCSYRILSVNRQGEKLLARSHDEIVHMHCSELYPRAKADEYRRRFTEDIEKQGYCDFEWEVITKNRAIVPVRIRASAQSIAEKKIIVAVFRDITKRKQAEESAKKKAIELETAYMELRETQAKLIQAGKMAAMGAMGVGIAHQLNQPLTGIRGFTQTILMQIDKNNPFYKELEKIEEQTGHMRDIILNISGFARQSEFRKEPVDINEPVNKALDLLSEQLRLHGIKLVKSLKPDLPRVNASFNHMQQVFLNFIMNARDALDDLPGDARKELSISTRMQKGKTGKSWIEIEFSDTGTGVSEDIKNRIYDPFFTTKGPGNTGLGLYLNYSLIQDNEGYIDLVSEEGKGASFIVKLPPSGSGQQQATSNQ